MFAEMFERVARDSNNISGRERSKSVDYLITASQKDVDRSRAEVFLKPREAHRVYGWAEKPPDPAENVE